MQTDCRLEAALLQTVLLKNVSVATRPSEAIARLRAAPLSPAISRHVLSEIFLFAQLHHLPRRVAEHHIEAAGRHHIGEFERPMEGVGLPGDILRPADQRAVDGAAGERSQTCAVVGIVTVLRLAGTPPVFGIRNAAA